MHNVTRRPLPLVAAGLSLALTACGGDGDSETGAAPEVGTSGFAYGEVPSENEKGPSIDESQMPPEPAPDAEAECPDVDLRTEKSYTCVVTYMGKEFEYLVERDEELSTDDYAAETARPVTEPVIVEQLEHEIRVFILMPYVDCDLEGEVAVAAVGEDVTACTALDDETGETEEYQVTYAPLGPAIDPV